MSSKKAFPPPKFTSAAIERDVLSAVQRIASPNVVLKEVVPLIQHLGQVPSVYELSARLDGDDVLTDALLSLRALALRAKSY